MCMHKHIIHIHLAPLVLKLLHQAVNFLGHLSVGEANPQLFKSYPSEWRSHFDRRNKREVIHGQKTHLTKLQCFIHFLQGMETYYEQNPLDFWIMLVIWWSQPREQEILQQRKHGKLLPSLRLTANAPENRPTGPRKDKDHRLQPSRNSGAKAVIIVSGYGWFLSQHNFNLPNLSGWKLHGLGDDLKLAQTHFAVLDPEIKGVWTSRLFSIRLISPTKYM